jgi:hypothetical protein
MTLVYRSKGKNTFTNSGPSIACTEYHASYVDYNFVCDDDISFLQNLQTACTIVTGPEKLLTITSMNTIMSLILIQQ